MRKLLLRRENILILVPFLFCQYIYFFKNDNPYWVLTFQGISESIESALGFCFIWWVIFLGSYILHYQLRQKNIAGLMRWLHIIFSMIFVAVYYWLFFEKAGIIPGWHTTITPFNFHFGNIEVSVLNFMLISGLLCQVFFVVFFLYKKNKS